MYKQMITSPTQSRLILYISIQINKAVCVLGCKDAGLDEAEQGVQLLEVVLNRSSCQQDSETYRELQKERN